MHYPDTYVQVLQDYLRFRGLSPDQYHFSFTAEPGDWVMTVNDTTITYNLKGIDHLSHAYRQTVLVHELHHAAFHAMPEKQDFKMLGEEFGTIAMQQWLDVDADVATAMYFASTGMTLETWCQLQYEAITTGFPGASRRTKFDRYFSSLISVAWSLSCGTEHTILFKSSSLDFRQELIGLAFTGRGPRMVRLADMEEDLDNWRHYYIYAQEFSPDFYVKVTMELLEKVIAALNASGVAA